MQCCWPEWVRSGHKGVSVSVSTEKLDTDNSFGMLCRPEH
jgi:hypothetical protein